MLFGKEAKIGNPEILQKAEEVYNKIMNMLPDGIHIPTLLDQEKNNSVSFTPYLSFEYRLHKRSPMFHTYYSHQRTPEINESYSIRNENGIIETTVYQGLDAEGKKAIRESIDKHPELHDNFEKILDWAVSIIPQGIENFLEDMKNQEQKEKEKERLKKSLTKLNKTLKSLNFEDVKELLLLMIPESLVQDDKFWSEIRELFANPETYLDEDEDTYKTGAFLCAAIYLLVDKNCAVWVDWKDLETFDFQIKNLLQVYSIHIPENLLHDEDAEVHVRAQTIANYLLDSLYRLVQIYTGGDEYIFFLKKLGSDSALEQAWVKVKELKLMPKRFKLQAEIG